MQHLFLPPEQFAGETATIIGPDHLHLARVLRARPGEIVVLLDNRGNAFRAVLVDVGKSETQARIEAAVPMPAEPPVFLTIAQALGKGDKFEQVIQHGTEAGASAFVPIRAERSVVDIPAARIADRLARWRLIAKGAAEQSGRGRIPEILPPITLAQLLRQSEQEASPLLLLHTDSESRPLRLALAALPAPLFRLFLAVGPEGGWSPAETYQTSETHGIPVSLGPRILRTETAALVAISQILFALETT